MIRALLTVCLRQRVATLVLAVFAMIAGLRAAMDVPIDAFPEFAPPRVEIQTEAPGLSSLEVEGLVTHPLEQALIGVPSSTAVRSKSVLGLSSVVVLFEPGMDLFRARTGHHAAHELDEPRAESGAVVDEHVDARSERARALDRASAADGDPRRRERRGVG